MAILPWNNPRLMEDVTQNCDPNQAVSAWIELDHGDKSRTVFASNFNFPRTASLPPSTEVDIVEVYIKSWAEHDGNIETDMLRLIRPPRTGSGATAPLVPSKNCISHCKKWKTTVCTFYSSFSGTPKQWGFGGKRLFPGDPVESDKTYLTIEDVRKADFGVVFRVANESNDDDQKCWVDSIRIVVFWTDSGGTSRQDDSYTFLVRENV